MTIEDAELTLLYKIVKNSKRVQEAREFFGLKEGEQIINFVHDKTGITCGNYPKDRSLRKVSSKDKSDLLVYHEEVTEWVQEHIIDHFTLSLEPKKVMDAIFRGKAVPRNTFHARTRVNQSGNFEITFEFFKMPNADAMKEIMKALKEHLYLLSEFFRTKNTKGLATTEADYKKIDSVQNFDERYDIAKEYREIQKKHPKYSPARTADIEELKEKAALKLNRKNGFTEDDLRKIVSEFQDYFREVKAS